VPLHDFECIKCGHIAEHFVYGNDPVECVSCGAATKRVFLVAAKPHWAALAMGNSASPEAIARFDRVHRQQKAKEDKSYETHGDYGPRPGAD
jgi:putative FmdB family regulatory protein